MTTESEQTLENNLLRQLVGQGYERVVVRDEAELVANLKRQLEIHNKTKLSDEEFKKVLNHLMRGNVFDKALALRDKFDLARDDGSHKNIEFLQMEKWCQNEFQVANQISNDGKYKNRYDVTILINGLPLVQIELKRPGIELKEAFNQVNRYRRHSYSANYGLFDFVQLFVISNGVNTKYYANTVGYDNTRKASFKFTSFWANRDNQKISRLSQFAEIFLERCHLAKMICKYIVLTTNKTLMVLRPYQFYAVEAIVDKVENSKNGGYIWHTTGSGKTLTSFKASQILVSNPNIYKVVFVVDRNDLDNQTIREFNNFSEGSVDSTTNTNKLVRQFNDPNTKLIVTTIQKLNTAISRERHQAKMEKLRNKRMVFIFDECHRSQFGETHKKITNYFPNHQLFGFTGTPIFAENAVGNELGKRTTKDLFGECLHKYVITDAINDENVLKFSVEYYSGVKYGGQELEDVKVEAIDIKEVFESDEWINNIVDFVIKNHDRKTKSREFTAMMAVSSVDVLTKYYNLFQAKKRAGEHNLKVATIFSYGANEEDKDADGMLDAEIDLDSDNINQYSRDRLESYIGDYNKMFGTNYTTKDSRSFYNYYRNISDRVKAREIDILLVVNMFLTGFDSKTLNTLYVDKNLKYHGLIQAYSRTNRILNETKSHGNIVVFRNLRQATNEALRLFANKNAREEVFLKPYDEYQKKFNEQVGILREIAKSPDMVDQLFAEEEKEAFIKAFRELLRLKNVLISFVEFNPDNVDISEQEFDEFKSKYLDLYEFVARDVERVSILSDLDFAIELIKRDEVNVSFILRLISQMVGASDEKQAEIKRSIDNYVSSELELRSKRELIEKFLKNNLPKIEHSSDVEQEFEIFWNEEQVAEMKKISQESRIKQDDIERIVGRYLSSGRVPRDHEIEAVLKARPSILERNSVIKRIQENIQKFFRVFVDGF